MVDTTITIKQTQPVAWESVEIKEDTLTGITTGHGYTEIQNDGEQDCNNNASHYIIKAEEDTTSRNIQASRRNLKQEVIFS